MSAMDGVRQEVKQKKWSRGRWLAASGAWTLLIMFSSTSLAAEYSERGFAWLYGSILGKLSRSHATFDRLHFVSEKGLHLTLFLVLGVLLSKLFTATRWRRLAEVVLLGLIVGSASEVLQRLFPGRDPAIRDVLINVAGTLLGAFFFISRG